MYKILASILAGATLSLLAMLNIITSEKTQPALASVAIGNSYIATTTAPAVSIMPVINQLVGTTTGISGTLGSIIQTGAGGVGSIDIYDATTTNVNARTGQAATSTLLLASIPTNAAAGTYTYDIQFNRGLLVVTTGTAGTTTLTYRIFK